MSTMGYKLLLAVMIFLLVVAIILYGITVNGLNRQTAESARLKIALSDCGLQKQAANAAVARQNAAIEAVRVDTVYVEKLIKEAERKYVEVREVVTQSLERDSSCENKIGNIDFALRRFHGVELRPAGDGKD
jgi:hypothetical protein